jgi:hypothetical protein
VPTVFEKLNLTAQRTIVVVDTPASFEPALAELANVEIARSPDAVDELSFVLAFVTTQAAIDALAPAIAAKAAGDAIVWFAYPKGSSKRYRCDFNRDTGWAGLGDLGFEGVRQVAIDEDWSALRFRRVEYIKTLRRDPTRALTAQGKARTQPPQEQEA